MWVSVMGDSSEVAFRREVLGVPESPDPIALPSPAHWIAQWSGLLCGLLAALLIGTALAMSVESVGSAANTATPGKCSCGYRGLYQ